MKISLFILLQTTLSAIAYQDFKYRAVNWIFFPLLAVSGFFYFNMPLNNIQQILENFFLNFLFIVMQLLGVWLFFILKEGKAVVIIDHKIGWGDIIFLITTGCFFSFPGFLFFNTLSLAFSLISYLLIKRKISSTSIPLAGLQSIFLAGIMILIEINQINFVGKYWIT